MDTVELGSPDSLNCDISDLGGKCSIWDNKKSSVYYSNKAVLTLQFRSRSPSSDTVYSITTSRGEATG